MLTLCLSNPYQAAHFELCPLKLLGINWCPGCGLGHSISYLFHGNIPASLHAHWLGIPAIIIIFRRILFLCQGFYVFSERCLSSL
ncbi:DUF2752 domain-containing protein [Mucilaginibacter paludis]|uniref:DUF2752 domain-containing protein n=1 Tax=Mucilaginibacter paludis TaxID=423351 RepID=UPI001E49FBF1|nr:DUF2752 domain-containing protein [Mucilaginibacter paludis]